MTVQRRRRRDLRELAFVPSFLLGALVIAAIILLVLALGGGAAD